MKNTLKLCLCFLVFLWTTNISAQQESTTQPSIKSIEKHQLKKKASGERTTAIQKKQKLKVEKTTIQQPKKTVIYSNRIECSSAPKLTRIAKKTTTQSVKVKPKEKEISKNIQLKQWKEQLAKSKLIVAEAKTKRIEEGSVLHQELKEHQERILMLEIEIAKQQ